MVVVVEVAMMIELSRINWIKKYLDKNIVTQKQVRLINYFSQQRITLTEGVVGSTMNFGYEMYGDIVDMFIWVMSSQVRFC